MTIVALDLGRYVGICVGAAGSTPRLSSREFPQNNGAIAAGFRGMMLGLIREHDPEVLAWERPFIDMKRVAQGELRTQRLYGQAFILEGLAHDCGMRTWWDRPASVRKTIIGVGSMKKIKGQDRNPMDDAIMEFAHRAGLRPANDHEADAYVIWVAASHAEKVKR